MMNKDLKWVHMFPWLVAHVDDSWTNEIADSTKGSRIAATASLAIEDHPTLPLFALLPLLDETAPLSEMGMSTRAVNLFTRERASTFGDISGHTVGDLLQFRNAGVTTVQSILISLLRASILGAKPGTVPPVDDEVEAFESTEMMPSGHPLQERLIDAIETISQWHRARNSSHAALLGERAFEAPVPEGVDSALRWLQTVTADQWLGDMASAPDPVALIEDAIGQLDERGIRILQHRILAEEPLTLDAIGADLGVTRERIRQLESKLRGQFASWLSPLTELGMVAAAIRQRLGGLSALERLLDDMPALREHVPAVSLPAWYVIDKLDDGFESDGTWVALTSLDTARRQSALRFQQAEMLTGVASIASLRAATSDWHLLSIQDLTLWYRSLGYREIDGHLMAPTLRSQPDLAAAYLGVRGQSATAEEIQLAVAPTASARSLRNRLGDDDRFVRVDRNEWALREWGQKEYTGIRDTLQRIITEKGPQAIDSLIEDLTADFDVSPKSIAAYSTAWPLETVNGIVRFAESRRVPRRTLSQTKGIYRTVDGVAMRLVVAIDHLRGSGFPVPVALATAVGLEPGQKIELTAATGIVSLGWNANQPALGSIRKELMALDIAAGELVFLRIVGDRFSVHSAGIEPREPSAAVRYWLGLTGTGDLESSQIASAIGLSAVSHWPTIVHALRDRGETEALQQLLEVLPEDSAFDPIHATPIGARFKIVAVDDI